MTSLSEAYGGKVGAATSLRRLYLGLGLFAVGALLVVAGIVVAATDLLVDRYGLILARQTGGILAGVGVPAVFLGILTVLPASRRTRAAAVIGASIAVLGVALFAHAYPCQWSGSNCGTTNLTLPTTGLYFLGTITTFWSLFVGVATFKRRNDPGGTARLEVVRQGETRFVEVERPSLGGLGGIGFLGGTPDGEVDTQTGDPASDGGSTAEDIRSPLGEAGPERPNAKPDLAPTTEDAEVMRETPARRDVGDRYCGNCSQFQYVRTDDGIQPYCGLHDELMDDMTACSEWQPRGGDGD
jgi:hypothetical protein